MSALKLTAVLMLLGLTSACSNASPWDAAYNGLMDVGPTDTPLDD